MYDNIHMYIDLISTKNTVRLSWISIKRAYRVMYDGIHTYKDLVGISIKTVYSAMYDYI